MDISPVELPKGLQGKLMVGPMPGRENPFAGDLALVQAAGVDRIVNLATEAEWLREAPDYRHAADSGLALPLTHYPIPPGGIPQDRKGLVEHIESWGKQLGAGENILVHCTTGIGRTGLIGICLLLSLGIPLMEASIRLADAGSGLESPEQEILAEYMSQYWQAG